jgi:hypothetical protein
MRTAFAVMLLVQTQPRRSHVYAGLMKKRRKLLTAGAPSHTHSPGSCLGCSATFVRNP